MTTGGLLTQRFARSSDLEPLGNGFPCLGARNRLRHKARKIGAVFREDNWFPVRAVLRKFLASRAVLRSISGMNTPAQQPHVIIIGAGFGGLEAAKLLACEPVRLTVIDRTNYHLF